MTSVPLGTPCKDLLRHVSKYNLQPCVPESKNGNLANQLLCDSEGCLSSFNCCLREAKETTSVEEIH